MVRLVNDYLQLRKAFPNVSEGDMFPITMAELANVLYCTQRNAKLILNKMVDAKWIAFVSGRGRGHTSELTFLLEKEDLLMRETQELAKSGELEAAFQLIKEFGEDTFVREQFLEWLSHYFGYEAEDRYDRYIETLKLPVYRPINTLDPAQSFYALDSHMSKQIFNTLVEYDYGTKKIVQGIAHYWTSNEQTTQWFFYLRKGVYFHHGKELSADDVMYSLLRLQDSSYAQSWLMQDVDTIHVLSRYVLQINLKRPNHLFLLFLSFTPASVVPRDVYDPFRHGGPRLPIGTGPYKVIKWTPGICILEAFTSYFQGRAFIDRIEIIIVPETEGEFTFEPKSNVLLVHTGEAEAQIVHDWKEMVDMCGSNLLTVNLNKQGILQNLDFRKALNHVINRQRMTMELGEPRLCPAQSFRLNDMPRFFDKDWNAEEGVRLLERSGYRGEVLELFTYKRHAPDACWLKEEYAKYGICVNVNIISWSDMLKRENIEKADFILFEAVLSEGLIRQIEYYRSANSFLRSHVSEEMASFIDWGVDEVVAEISHDGRERKLKEIEQKLKEEYALIFLVYKIVSATSHPSLQGVKVNPRGWVDFKDVWFQHTEKTQGIHLT